MLAPLIVVPAATFIVLLIDGTAFESAPRQWPDYPCPASVTAEKGVHPTDFTESARPYAGAGPHLVTSDDSSLVDRMPSRWKVPPRRNATTSELVVCAYEKDTGERGEDCRYHHGITLPLTKSRATYRLFEAKTSKLVAGFQFKGEGGCPRSIHYYKGNPPSSLPQDIDQQDVIAELRPYVEGPVRKGNG
ncbi:hypothetical protein ACWGH5_35520 [Streptomyces sp. NPDC054864]